MPDSEQLESRLAVAPDESRPELPALGSLPNGEPDPETVLVPKLPEHMAPKRLHLFVLAIGCLFFMYYNYMKLFHSDFWGHVSYGQWIVQHKALPQHEPFVALADGVPVVATAWLSQAILGLIDQTRNVEWFSHLFAATMLAVYVAYAITFYQQSRNILVAVISCGLVFFTGWSRHAVIRPEMFGSLCFALLMLSTVLSDTARQRLPDESPQPLPWKRAAGYWAVVAGLFALWANLHGSFIVGYALLGSYALGRGVEVLLEKRDLLAVFADTLVRQRLIACWAALGGTLLNPYGFDLLIHTLVFPSNPNLKDVFEWFPLEFVSLEGPFVALAVVLTIVLLRHSRARVAVSDVLMLSIFALATGLRIRMIAWLGPALMLALTPHLDDVLTRLYARLQNDDLQKVADWLQVRSFRYVWYAGFIAWVAFCFSPASVPFLGGKPREARHIFSSDTPRGITEWLREHPPQGRVANPQWWGDWLIYDGPPGLDLLMTTNAVHVVPPQVWEDYLAIARGEEGLERRLARYRINTVIVCKQLQGSLHRTMDSLSGWDTVFEDDIGMVLVRHPLAPMETDNAVKDTQPLPENPPQAGREVTAAW